MIYYIVLIIGIILAIVNDKKRISFQIFILVLFLFSIFRYGVGADYLSYQYLYGLLQPTVAGELANGISSVDVGFRIFGLVLRSLGISYQVYLGIIAAINLFFIARICKEHSENPTLSLVLYFCFYYLVWTWSGLREGLTIAIGMYYLLRYINQRKHIRFLVIVTILFSIHASSITLIPLYFVARIKFTRKSLIIIAACSIAFALIPIESIVQIFANNPLVKRVLPYLDSGSSLSRLLDFKSIARITFLIVALFYYNAYAERGESSQKLMNIYIISFAIYFVLQFSETAAARVAIYGKILDMIFLVNIYYIYREKINRVIYAAMLVALIVLYFNKELGTMKQQTGIVLDNRQTMPYTHIFEKDGYKYDNIYYDVIIEDQTDRY